LYLYYTLRFINHGHIWMGSHMFISRQPGPARRPAPSSVAAVLVALAVVLAGCSNNDGARETLQPVLVAHPDGGADAGFTAYAGEIHARQESPLSFRIGGNLVRRNVDAGDRVRAGQVLAELDPGDSRLQVDAAQAEMSRLGGDLERYRKLLAQKLVSQSVFDSQQAAYRAARAQYELMRNQARYTRLLAPSDGVIATRQAEAGQVVAAGQTVFTLAADGGREVAIALPESRIRGFRVGQPALVELWNAPDARLPGTIREIAPAADATARTYATRVALQDDAARQVELGQSARVYIREGDAQAAALAIPLSAIQRGANGATSVWVVDPRTRTLKAKPVRLGAFGESRVPVLAGLDARDWVVTAGGHLLRTGQRVEPVDRDNRPVLPSTAASPATTAAK
jgi:multidrug efflux system membrane fusion protein